jgi:hypothetical protein
VLDVIEVPDREQPRQMAMRGMQYAPHAKRAKLLLGQLAGWVTGLIEELQHEQAHPPEPKGLELAPALDRHPVRPIGAAEVGRLPPISGEARVERAVRVVAGGREVTRVGAAEVGAADNDALAVALDRHPGCPPTPKDPKLVVCLPSPEKLASKDADRGASG